LPLRVARVDGEDGRQRRVKHTEFHRFLGRGHNMFVSLEMGLPPRPGAGLFGARKSGEPRLDGSESPHEAACYQELSAMAAAHREVAVKSLLFDFVHMEQAIRGALIEGGILDVFSNDPCTLLVATAEEIATVVMVMMMMMMNVFVLVSVLVL